MPNIHQAQAESSDALRIVVCLTSIKAREAALRETLCSVVKQRCEFEYEVRLYLSREPYLMDEGFSDEPKWIEEVKALNTRCRLSVHFVPNTGPYRKIIPALGEFMEGCPDVVLVTCDDDTQYKPTWLSTLIARHRNHGGIVAFRGHTACLGLATSSDTKSYDTQDSAVLAPYANWQRNTKKTDHSLLNLPTGKDGVVYRPHHFDRAVLDMQQAMAIAPTADDLWLRWHTWIRAIPCHLIDLGDRVFADAPSFDADVSLWSVYNKKGGNDKTIAALEDHFIKTRGFPIARSLAAYESACSQLNSRESLVDHQLRTGSPGSRFPAAAASLSCERTAHDLHADQSLRRLYSSHGPSLQDQDHLKDINKFLTLQASNLELIRYLEHRHGYPPTFPTESMSQLRGSGDDSDEQKRSPIQIHHDQGGMLYAQQCVDRFDQAYGWMSRAVEPSLSNIMVSVIMTTFNAQDTLEWAARSILEQDHENLELIIVDDMSTDGTRDLLRTLKARDPRIRVILPQKNRGTYFAKNIAIKRARGQVITFQDADDWSHPARLRLQLWRLHASAAKATRCNYVRHHDRLNTLVKVNDRLESPGFITLMAERSMFEQVGYFDCSRRAADDELICRLQALYGARAIDTFALPAYVALYCAQSLIADSSTFSSATGLRFQLGQDRQEYKQAYTQWHLRLQADPSLKRAYEFPPKSNFIEKMKSLRAFEDEEIAMLEEEVMAAHEMGQPMNEATTIDERPPSHIAQKLDQHKASTTREAAR